MKEMLAWFTAHDADPAIHAEAEKLRKRPELIPVVADPVYREAFGYPPLASMRAADRLLEMRVWSIASFGWRPGLQFTFAPGGLVTVEEHTTGCDPSEPSVHRAVKGRWSVLRVYGGDNAGATEQVVVRFSFPPDAKRGYEELTRELTFSLAPDWQRADILWEPHLGVTLRSAPLTRERCSKR